MSERLDRDDIQGLLARGYGTAAPCVVRPASYRGRRVRALGCRPVGSRVTPASRVCSRRGDKRRADRGGVLALTGKSALDLGFSEPYATGW